MVFVWRVNRNLSEKKRRDQFNMLVNELCSMVSTSSKKMDKSTVLKSTIAYLKTYQGMPKFQDKWYTMYSFHRVINCKQEYFIFSETAVQAQAHEIKEDWKPSFLSNDEFMHLMLEVRGPESCTIMSSIYDIGYSFVVLVKWAYFWCQNAMFSLLRL